MNHSILEPGMFVRHPKCPEWGVGQVQSRIGNLVTVNFPDEGKKVINGDLVTLEIVYNL
nr:DUF3553 domain-containing protein [Roseinatronobacter sp. S2]